MALNGNDIRLIISLTAYLCLILLISIISGTKQYQYHKKLYNKRNKTPNNIINIETKELQIINDYNTDSTSNNDTNNDDIIIIDETENKYNNIKDNSETSNNNDNNNNNNNSNIYHKYTNGTQNNNNIYKYSFKPPSIVTRVNSTSVSSVSTTDVSSQGPMDIPSKVAVLSKQKSIPNGTPVIDKSPSISQYATATNLGIFSLNENEIIDIESPINSTMMKNLKNDMNVIKPPSLMNLNKYNKTNDDNKNLVKRLSVSESLGIRMNNNSSYYDDSNNDSNKELSINEYNTRTRNTTDITNFSVPMTSPIGLIDTVPLGLHKSQADLLKVCVYRRLFLIYSHIYMCL